MIVDFRGRPVSEIPISRSSLVKAQQWQEWLLEWFEQVKASDPWCLFLVEAVVNLHQSFIILSRRFRKNEYWTGAMTMRDQTVKLSDDAEERLAIFEKGKREVSLQLCPKWACDLFEAVEGALRMQVRLAREAEQILKKGHLLVNVNPRAQTRETARELGEETDAAWTG